MHLSHISEPPVGKAPQIDRFATRTQTSPASSVSGIGNPNSAGTYSFKPAWTVGDEYVFQQVDLYSNVVRRKYRIVVKRVDVANDRVEVADGSLVDLMGSVLREGMAQRYEVPIQIKVPGRSAP
jgi:hypothetical protein